jgi:galactose mutarotase-like enzyme
MENPITSIASDGLSAEINAMGAQLFALRDAEGRDLLWDGDPAIWNGRAPLLFPIVGELAGGEYRLDGQSWRLPRHGFARNRLFRLVEAGTATALFRLTWDEETYRAYPFHFELDIRFALDGAALTIAATVRNLETSRILPASFGFHPALRWPLPYGQPRADHAVTFQTDEAAPIRRLDAKGLVQPVPLPTPVKGRSLALRDDLFAHDALIFDRLQSRTLRYGADTGPHITVDFPDTGLLGLWTKPGAPFVCIEPWHGIADPEGFTGDFRDKPGIFLVAPGGTKDCRMILSLHP